MTITAMAACSQVSSWLHECHDGRFMSVSTEFRPLLLSTEYLISTKCTMNQDALLGHVLTQCQETTITPNDCGGIIQIDLHASYTAGLTSFC